MEGVSLKTPVKGFNNDRYVDSKKINTKLAKKKEHQSSEFLTKRNFSKRKYIIIKSIGYGSFSNVKLAHSQTRLPGLVAIKIISRSKVPESYLLRFLPREIEFWPKLNHPNIVKCHETFVQFQSVYIVLEYACNGDMMTYINNYGPLSEEKTKTVTKQVCNAVKYLHDKDITHRDLKLENLLLDKNSNIKITDFGFVKNYTKWELSHTFCGTKSYAAPEILSAQPYDARKVDTWAIGAIIYVLCTGKMPFDESRAINKILEQQKQLSLNWYREKISKACKDLIVYLFTYKYRRRPTMHEVVSNKWFKENPPKTVFLRHLLASSQSTKSPPKIEKLKISY